MSEPPGIHYHHVKLVAMGDQQALSIGSPVYVALLNLDPTKMNAFIGSQDFVMIAGHIDDVCTGTRLAQKFLNYIVVCLRPAKSPCASCASNQRYRQPDKSFRHHVRGENR